MPGKKTKTKDAMLHNRLFCSKHNILGVYVFEQVSGKNREEKMKSQAFIAAGCKKFSTVKQVHIILSNIHTLFYRNSTETQIQPKTFWRTRSEQNEAETGRKTHWSYVFRGIQFCSCQTSLYSCFVLFFFSSRIGRFVASCGETKQAKDGHSKS